MTTGYDSCQLDYGTVASVKINQRNANLTTVLHMIAVKQTSMSHHGYEHVSWSSVTNRYHSCQLDFSNSNFSENKLTKRKTDVGTAHARRRQLSSKLVSWCFEPSQAQRITSGLNTNFTISPSYSFHNSSNQK